jgi:hypothetical protein
MNAGGIVALSQWRPPVWILDPLLSVSICVHPCKIAFLFSRPLRLTTTDQCGRFKCRVPATCRPSDIAPFGWIMRTSLCPKGTGFTAGIVACCKKTMSSTCPLLSSASGRQKNICRCSTLSAVSRRASLFSFDDIRYAVSGFRLFPQLNIQHSTLSFAPLLPSPSLPVRSSPTSDFRPLTSLWSSAFRLSRKVLTINGFVLQFGEKRGCTCHFI